MVLHLKERNTRLNSLASKCIKTICLHPHCISDVNSEEIPVVLKQEIVDHIIQQRTAVSLKFICNLLKNVQRIDLWTLADASSFTCDDMRILFSSVASSCLHLTDLSIGGSWIFESPGISLLKVFFDSVNLSQLKRLCVQQLTIHQLTTIIDKCIQLEVFKIRQPCISDFDVKSITNTVGRASVIKLCIPSSLHDESIVVMTNFFPAIKCLKVARFEGILRAMMCNNLPSNYEKAKNIFTHLQSLTITQALGPQTVSLLVKICPSLTRLSLHVQECMDIASITQFKKLKSLELKNCTSSPVSYAEDIMYILREIGNNLHSLSVEYFDVFNLSQTFNLCPNLHSFSAQWFNSIDFDAGDGVNKLLRDLHRIRLRPNPAHIITSSLIHYILQRTVQLQYCEVYYCDLNQHHLTKMDKLIHLRCLIMRHGKRLEKQFIDQLTRSLSKLEYFACDESVVDDC